MTLHDVNIQIFRLIAKENPSVDVTLRQALKPLSHAEAFTFLRMAHECKSQDPVSLLQRLRNNPQWEKHCDLGWQKSAVEYYTQSLQKTKAA
jgi:hypothetical protein